MRIVLDTNVLLSALISPHGLQPHRVGTMINRLHRAVVLGQHTSEHPTADPDDAFLLAMAEAGHADYLITGDRRAGLLQRGRVGRTQIVTPSVFCSAVLKQV